MKKIFASLQNLKSQAGFTMIELLIVIAILGILAVAVLSAINPVEQINRGRDTGSRSDAEQLLSAIDRFYAFQGYVPWRSGPADAGADAQAWLKLDDENWATWFDTLGACPVLEKLSNANPTGTDLCSTHSDELKTTFLSRIIDGNYNSLFIYNEGLVGSSTYVCFKPQSKAFATEALNRLDANADDTPEGLPADYPTEAYSTTLGGAAVLVTGDCGSDGNCVCLP